MNKLLMEENDRLQKQVSQLVYNNGYMRQQLHPVSLDLSYWPLDLDLDLGVPLIFCHLVMPNCSSVFCLPLNLSLL